MLASINAVQLHQVSSELRHHSVFSCGLPCSLRLWASGLQIPTYSYKELSREAELTCGINLAQSKLTFRA
jgi:hypothetical protein